MESRGKPFAGYSAAAAIGGAFVFNILRFAACEKRFTPPLECGE
jgi:hypothetical protein